MGHVLMPKFCHVRALLKRWRCARAAFAVYAAHAHCWGASAAYAAYAQLRRDGGSQQAWEVTAGMGGHGGGIKRGRGGHIKEGC